MKSRIDGYGFGRMKVAGQEFTSDLVIHPDGRIEDNWWRGQGHNLVPGDIHSILEAAPAKLIIGTGASGLMKVSEAVMKQCKERGIEVEAHPTAEAVERFNEAAETDGGVAACFHLTC